MAAEEQHGEQDMKPKWQKVKDYQDIRYEAWDGIAKLTINRPEVRNALHSYAYVELRSCWRDIGLDVTFELQLLPGRRP